MTLFWRISDHLSPGGAQRSPRGRWHTAKTGKRAVCLSEHPAVALIEHLVNLGGPPRFFPSRLQLLKIMSAPHLEASELTPKQIARFDSEQIRATQAIGDAWPASNATALLHVPSIPSPESWNFLLNPQHPHASALTIAWARPITYNRRLFHLAHA